MQRERPHITQQRMPFWRKLRWRFVIAFVALTVAAVALVTLILLVQMNNRIEEEIVNKLEVVAELKRDQINRWIEDNRLALDLLLADFREVHLGYFIQGPTEIEQESFDRVFRDAVETHDAFTEFFVYDLNGRVLTSSNEAWISKVVRSQPYFEPSTLDEYYIQPPYYQVSTNDLEMLITRRLSINGEPVGVLAGRLDMSTLGNIMSDRTGLGENGRAILVGATSQFLLMPGDTEFRLRRAPDSEGLSRALNQEEGAGTYVVESDPPEHVIGVYRWIPNLDAALLAEVNQSEALKVSRQSVLLGAAMAAGTALIAAFAGLVIGSSLTQPVIELAQVATRIASGNRSLRAPIRGRYELDQLANAFNTMAEELNSLIGQLERRVDERTRDLVAISDVGRTATQIYDQERLPELVVNLIRDRFGFYHVQVFLVDETGREAVLRASTGDVGRMLLERGHSLPVGGQSVIGQVTAAGQPVVALDTEEAEVVHRANPLLPDTRSEMALPLRIGERIIGALDLQSTEPNAFDPQNLQVFQGMADQVAIAIHNSNLLRLAEQRTQEIEALNRELVGQTWGRFLRGDASQPFGYTADGSGVRPSDGLTPQQARALKQQTPQVEYLEDRVKVIVPVPFRDFNIGVLEFEMLKDEYNEEKLTLAQMFAARLGVSADSARLFENSRQQTRREQTIGSISGLLQQRSRIEDVLSVAVAEIGEALGARRSAVRLGGDEVLMGGNSGDSDGAGLP